MSPGEVGEVSPDEVGEVSPMTAVLLKEKEWNQLWVCDREKYNQNQR